MIRDDEAFLGVDDHARTGAGLGSLPLGQLEETAEEGVAQQRVLGAVGVTCCMTGARLTTRPSAVTGKAPAWATVATIIDRPHTPTASPASLRRMFMHLRPSITPVPDGSKAPPAGGRSARDLPQKRPVSVKRI
jgi:hypothetical protein